MARHRKRSKKINISDIIALFFLLILLTLFSNCGKKLSPLEKTATYSANKTESFERWKDYTDTRIVHNTAVEETRERIFIERTLTAIYERTVRPTRYYESTQSILATRTVQQGTVDAILLELHNEE